ncbi:uncharacterized protein TNCV_2502651 [Trichonephila clavipes]|nr:uncharacterized protein TNCV_2502651 [Trichonephila clavipes]
MPSIGGYHPYGLASILTGLESNRACMDMLGRRIAAHQTPPTCLPELRMAFLDEWCNIPQDQIDNLILSMPRRSFLKTVLEKVDKDVKAMPLSESIVSRRIDKMDEDIEKQLVEKLKTGKFTVQMDESTLRDSETVLITYRTRFCCFKQATDHDVGDETEKNSANPQTLVVENQYINPPEEPELSLIKEILEQREKQKEEQETVRKQRREAREVKKGEKNLKLSSCKPKSINFKPKSPVPSASKNGVIRCSACKKRNIGTLQQKNGSSAVNAKNGTNMKARMWFQHDGAPAHFSADGQSALDAEYPGQWIGRCALVNRPARSSDLSCLDFFL